MRKILFLVLLVSTANLYAQEKILTPEVIMSDRSFYPARLTQMQWGSQGNTLYYLKGSDLMAVDFKGKEKPVISLAKINETMRGNDFGTFKRFPYIEQVTNSTLIFMRDSLLLSYDYLNHKVSVINNVFLEAENTDTEYLKYQIAFTIDNNLFVSVKGNIIQLTKEDNNAVVYGRSVHREEFGIEKGTFWSPNGNYLAFYRMDESMVTEYPMVKMEDPIAIDNKIRYPMAGTSNHKVTVGIYDITKEKMYYLQTSHWDDQYLTNISWSPDEKYIYVAVLNRNQKEMMLNQYRVSDGTFTKTIFSESHSKYVEPLHPLYFTDETGSNFIWQSQRDGYNHLYLYNINNSISPIQLTKGNWVVNEILGMSKDRKQLLIVASKESPIEREVYSIEMKNKNMQKLSKNKGINEALLSADGSMLVNSVSNTEISNRVIMMDNRGKEVKVLLEENRELQDFLSPVEIFTIKTRDDNTELYCRIIKPKNFDSNKKYPVIVYVYGGPHAQMISNSWTGGAGLFLHYLSQQGFIVFTVDNRGSANRGLDFEQSVYRNLGELECEDQIQGVNYLKTLPYVDIERIGVHGWSYGGFMAINLMLKYPDIFKVGVAGGPVCDWKYYEVMYGERYMGTPSENPEGYEKSSLINRIQDLKGKLLVVHGDNDPVVLWQHSMMLLKQAVHKRVLLDYFVYPGHEHNISGMDRAHLMRKIETYFKDFL